MTMSDGYSILFEPVKIGPVTARNRFYQVPHCDGLGHQRPKAEAALRGMKAEGGWAVVSTQETEIHPTSDLTPFPENRLWDDRDIPALRLITEAVHEKGALAAIQLAHNGNHSANHMSRAPILAPRDMSLDLTFPKQARAMDKTDIRNFRKWHRAAARRSKEAGFDIIYVYAGHYMTLPHHFLLSKYNDRTDEYGGSLENRTRLIRELLEETKEEVGDTCAVAFRFAVDEVQGAEGMHAHEEGRGVIELLADLPDLWDINVTGWSNDSATARFEPNEGYQTKYIEFVKQVTSKPVVGVGRITSPDMMVSMVKRGIVDFIGAARPSIADPFIPNKIRDGRIDEIRECIGCNICVMADNLGVPIRCTQNPTMGEEWRRGWHPEKIAEKKSEASALVIGSGPAGLECAMQLARRGYDITLAEARGELGGRVLLESALPGLGSWKRVIDHRIYDLHQRANVQMYTDSPLTAEQVVELGIPNVFVATGSRWRSDGRGRTEMTGFSSTTGAEVLTPDDILSGKLPKKGPVVIYDDDQGYLGGVIAEHLATHDLNVTIVTPSAVVSPFTELTLEQKRVQKRLLELGVRIIASHSVRTVSATTCEIYCAFTNRATELPCATLVTVTERMREVQLFENLRALPKDTFQALELIGDASGSGLIADAVYSGHMAARSFERDPEDVEKELFRREIASLADDR